MVGFGPLASAPLAATSGATIVEVTDTLTLAATMGHYTQLNVIELLRLTPTLTPQAHLSAALSDAVVFSDPQKVILQAIIADGVAFSDAALGTRGALIALIDSLRMSGAVTTTYSALGTLIDTMALAGVITQVQEGTITDEVGFTEALAAQVAWYAQLVDDALFADTATGLANVVIQLTDTVALTDETNATGSFIEAIREQLDFAISFSFGDEAYVAYAMNANTKALTSYTNYNFNSLAKFGPHTYAAGAAGLYKIGGTTDAGEDIIWRVRTGLTNLGSGRMKGLDAAYIGYTASGDVHLKCVVVSSSGEKIGYWYKLTPQAAGVSRPGRIPTGRGLRSVYWGFEMTNLTAGDIELDVLELHPIVFEGRLG